jgi:hypothetical protein
MSDRFVALVFEFMRFVLIRMSQPDNNDVEVRRMLDSVNRVEKEMKL